MKMVHVTLFLLTPEMLHLLSQMFYRPVAVQLLSNQKNQFYARRNRENHSKIHGCRSNTKTITVESNAVNHEGGRVALKIKGKLLN
jgi:hypothetical protein